MEETDLKTIKLTKKLKSDSSENQGSSKCKKKSSQSVEKAIQDTREVKLSDLSKSHSGSVETCITNQGTIANEKEMFGDTSAFNSSTPLKTPLVQEGSKEKQIKESESNKGIQCKEYENLVTPEKNVLVSEIQHDSVDKNVENFDTTDKRSRNTCINNTPIKHSASEPLMTPEKRFEALGRSKSAVDRIIEKTKSPGSEKFVSPEKHLETMEKSKSAVESYKKIIQEIKSKKTGQKNENSDTSVQEVDMEKHKKSDKLNVFESPELEKYIADNSSSLSIMNVLGTSPRDVKATGKVGNNAERMARIGRIMENVRARNSGKSVHGSRKTHKTDSGKPSDNSLCQPPNIVGSEEQSKDIGTTPFKETLDVTTSPSQKTPRMDDKNLQKSDSGNANKPGVRKSLVIPLIDVANSQNSNCGSTAMNDSDKSSNITKSQSDIGIISFDTAKILEDAGGNQVDDGNTPTGIGNTPVDIGNTQTDTRNTPANIENAPADNANTLSETRITHPSTGITQTGIEKVKAAPETSGTDDLQVSQMDNTNHTKADIMTTPKPQTGKPSWSLKVDIKKRPKPLKLKTKFGHIRKTQSGEFSSDLEKFNEAEPKQELSPEIVFEQMQKSFYSKSIKRKERPFKASSVQNKTDSGKEHLSVLTKEILQNLQPVVQLVRLSPEQIDQFTSKYDVTLPKIGKQSSQKRNTSLTIRDANGDVSIPKGVRNTDTLLTPKDKTPKISGNTGTLLMPKDKTAKTSTALKNTDAKASSVDNGNLTSKIPNTEYYSKAMESVTADDKNATILPVGKTVRGRQKMDEILVNENKIDVEKSGNKRKRNTETNESNKNTNTIRISNDLNTEISLTEKSPNVEEDAETVVSFPDEDAYTDVSFTEEGADLDTWFPNENDDKMSLVEKDRSDNTPSIIDKATFSNTALDKEVEISDNTVSVLENNSNADIVLQKEKETSSCEKKTNSELKSVTIKETLAEGLLDNETETCDNVISITETETASDAIMVTETKTSDHAISVTETETPSGAILVTETKTSDDAISITETETHDDAILVTETETPDHPTSVSEAETNVRAVSVDESANSVDPTSVTESNLDARLPSVTKRNRNLNLKSPVAETDMNSDKLSVTTRHKNANLPPFTEKNTNADMSSVFERDKINHVPSDNEIDAVMAVNDGGKNADGLVITEGDANADILLVTEKNKNYLVPHTQRDTNPKVPSVIETEKAYNEMSPTELADTERRIIIDVAAVTIKDSESGIPEKEAESDILSVTELDSNANMPSDAKRNTVNDEIPSGIERKTNDDIATSTDKKISIDVLSDLEGEAKITEVVTCTSEIFTCSVCGKKYTDEFAYHFHRFNRHKAKEDENSTEKISNSQHLQSPEDIFAETEKEKDGIIKRRKKVTKFLDFETKLSKKKTVVEKGKGVNRKPKIQKDIDLLVECQNRSEVIENDGYFRSRKKIRKSRSLDTEIPKEMELVCEDNDKNEIIETDEDKTVSSNNRTLPRKHRILKSSRWIDQHYNIKSSGKMKTRKEGKIGRKILLKEDCQSDNSDQKNVTVKDRNVTREKLVGKGQDSEVEFPVKSSVRENRHKSKDTQREPVEDDSGSKTQDILAVDDDKTNVRKNQSDERRTNVLRKSSHKRIRTTKKKRRRVKKKDPATDAIYSIESTTQSGTVDDSGGLKMHIKKAKTTGDNIEHQDLNIERTKPIARLEYFEDKFSLKTGMYSDISEDETVPVTTSVINLPHKRHVMFAGISYINNFTKDGTVSVVQNKEPDIFGGLVSSVTLDKSSDQNLVSKKNHSKNNLAETFEKSYQQIRNELEVSVSSDTQCKNAPTKETVTECATSSSTSVSSKDFGNIFDNFEYITLDKAIHNVSDSHAFTSKLASKSVDNVQHFSSNDFTSRDMTRNISLSLPFSNPADSTRALAPTGNIPENSYALSANTNVIGNLGILHGKGIDSVHMSETISQVTDSVKTLMTTSHVADNLRFPASNIDSRLTSVPVSSTANSVGASAASSIMIDNIGILSSNRIESTHIPVAVSNTVGNACLPEHLGPELDSLSIKSQPVMAFSDNSCRLASNNTGIGSNIGIGNNIGSNSKTEIRTYTGISNNTRIHNNTGIGGSDGLGTSIEMGNNNGIGNNTVTNKPSLASVTPSNKISHSGTVVRKETDKNSSVSDFPFKRPGPVAEKRKTMTSPGRTETEEKRRIDLVYTGLGSEESKFKTPAKRNVMFINMSSKKARALEQQRREAEHAAQSKVKKQNVPFLFTPLFKKRKKPSESTKARDTEMTESYLSTGLSPTKIMKLNTPSKISIHHNVEGTCKYGDSHAPVTDVIYPNVFGNYTEVDSLTPSIGDIHHDIKLQSQQGTRNTSDYSYFFGTSNTNANDHLDIIDVNLETIVNTPPVQVTQEKISKTSHISELHIPQNLDLKTNDQTIIEIVDEDFSMTNTHADRIIDELENAATSMQPDVNLGGELDAREKTIQSIYGPLKPGINFEKGISKGVIDTDHSLTIDTNRKLLKVPGKTGKLVHTELDQDVDASDRTARNFSQGNNMHTHQYVNVPHMGSRDILHDSGTNSVSISSIGTSNISENSASIGNVSAIQHGHTSINPQSGRYKPTQEMDNLILNENKRLVVSLHKLTENEIKNQNNVPSEETLKYNDYEQDSDLPSLKPWHCVLCSQRYRVRREAMHHVVMTHEISQFDSRLKEYICRLDDLGNVNTFSGKMSLPVTLPDSATNVEGLKTSEDILETSVKLSGINVDNNNKHTTAQNQNSLEKADVIALDDEDEDSYDIDILDSDDSGSGMEGRRKKQIMDNRNAKKFAHSSELTRNVSERGRAALTVNYRNSSLVTTGGVSVGYKNSDKSSEKPGDISSSVITVPDDIPDSNNVGECFGGQVMALKTQEGDLLAIPWESREKTGTPTLQDMSWKCLICGIKFRLKIDVIQHIKMKHKDLSTASNTYIYEPLSPIIDVDSPTTESSKNYNRCIPVGRPTIADRVIRRKKEQKKKMKLKDTTEILIISSRTNVIQREPFQAPLAESDPQRKILSVKWHCKLCPNWYRLRKCCLQHVQKEHNIRGNWARFYFHNSQQVTSHPSMEICTGPHVDVNAYSFCIVCGRSYSDPNEIIRHVRRNHAYVPEVHRSKCVLNKLEGIKIVVACDIFMDLHVYTVGNKSAKLVDKDFFAELFENGINGDRGDFKESDIATAKQLKRILYENGMIKLKEQDLEKLKGVEHNFDLYKISFKEDFQWERNKRATVSDPDQIITDTEDEREAPSDLAVADVVSLHRCHKCNITFPDRMSLDKHKLTHKVQVRFTCRLCNKNFPKLYFLLQHLEIKHNQKNPNYFQFVLEHEQIVEDETDVESEDQNDDNSVTQKPDDHNRKIAELKQFEDSDQELDETDVLTTETRTCFVCGKNFETRVAVFTHLKEKHDIYNRKCLTCNKSFSSKLELQKHFSTVHDIDFVVDLSEQIIRCFFCDIVFDSREALKEHVPVHKREGYNCNMCDMKYTSGSSLRFHKRTVHWKMEGTRSCKICDKIFTNMKAYESHMVTHFYDFLGPMKCTKCDLTLKNKKAYKQHIASHGVSTVCEHCGKVCVDQHALRHHIVTHNLNHKCQICGKKLNKYSLKNHMAKVHGEKGKAACHLCGKLVNQDYIQAHVEEMHNKVKVIKKNKKDCDYCGKIFKRPGLLKQHMVVHTGEKPHSCEVCGKSFGHKTALNTHYTTHKGFKPQKCQFCNSSFWLISQCKAHMKEVHGYTDPKLKHACSYCDKRFKHLSGLRLHLDELHPEKVPGPKFYPCHKCKKEFKYRKSLREHMATCAPGTQLGRLYNRVDEADLSRDSITSDQGQSEIIETFQEIVQNPLQIDQDPTQIIGADGTIHTAVGTVDTEQQIIIQDQSGDIAYQTIYIQSDDPNNQGTVYMQDIANQDQIIVQNGGEEGELIVALPEDCGEYNVDFLSSSNEIMDDSEIGYAEIVVQDQ